MARRPRGRAARGGRLRGGDLAGGGGARAPARVPGATLAGHLRRRAGRQRPHRPPARRPGRRRPTGLLSHRTAAELHGIETRWWRGRADEIHLSTIRPAHARSHPGLVAHSLTRLAPEDREVRDGLACTALPRTVTDLAREPRRDDLIGLVAWLLQRRRSTLEELHAAAERARGVGAQRLVALLAEWEPGVESLAEFRFAKGVRRSDLPSPEWNRIVVAEGIAILQVPARVVLADLDRVLALVRRALQMRSAA